MNYFRSTASAAALGLALVAASAHAQGRCEYGTPLEFTPDLKGKYATNQAVVDQIVSSPIVQAQLNSAPAQCRPFVVSESLRISGLTAAEEMKLNTVVKIAVALKFIPEQLPPPKEAVEQKPVAADPALLAKQKVQLNAELEVAQAKLAEAVQEKKVLEPQVQAIKNTTRVSNDGYLSSEDRALLKNFIVLKKTTIPAWSGEVKAIASRLEVVENDLKAVKADLLKKADTTWVEGNFTPKSETTALVKRVGGLEDLLNPTSENFILKGVTPTEKGWWEWLLIFVVSPLALILALRGPIAALGRWIAATYRELFPKEEFEARRPLSAANDLPSEEVNDNVLGLNQSMTAEPEPLQATR